LRDAGIAYRVINLDAATYRADRMGDRLRWALRDKLGSATLPQVFLGKRYLGGAGETLRAFEDSCLEADLGALELTVPAETAGSATSYLPKWVHPRQATA
jgi:cysteine synthase A